MAHETYKRETERRGSRIKGAWTPTRFLGSLQGQGRLHVDGEDLGAVSYEVEGYSDRQGERGNGRIEGPAESLRRAFAQGSAQLAIRDGSTLQVALSDPEDGCAEFRVTGDLPGFK